MMAEVMDSMVTVMPVETVNSDGQGMYPKVSTETVMATKAVPSETMTGTMSSEAPAAVTTEVAAPKMSAVTPTKAESMSSEVPAVMTTEMSAMMLSDG